MRTIVFVLLSALSVMLAGCANDDGFTAVSERQAPAEPAVAVPQPLPVPWQLTPASTASIAQGENTIVVPNEKFGKVKGTPIAIANLEKPVVAYARRGRVVEACRAVIEPQAKGIGAFSVQAAAAGPETTKNGDRVQQVFFRIIYDRPEYVEVRQAALICKVGRDNRVVDAKPI